MSDSDAIVQDPVTGLFGFRLEMGRDHGGIRMQARRQTPLILAYVSSMNHRPPGEWRVNRAASAAAA